MEEQKLKENTPMSDQDFKNYLEKNRVDVIEDFKNGILHLVTYEAVSKFKSIRRAIRRGLVTPYGTIIPKRPFSNKANTCKRKSHHSRKINELKKQIYGQLKQRATA